MKAVILAAGEGGRMQPLTLKTPKPMLKIHGKPLLEYLLESLPKEIDEIIVVVGYLGDQIKKHFGGDFQGKKIRYVEQKEKLGTWKALELCKSLLGKGNFLLLYADDLHSPLSLQRCIKRGSMCVLLEKAPNPERFGVVILNPDKSVKEIEEKPKHPKSNLISCGPYVLNEKIFDYPPEKHENGEYYIPESVSQMAKDYKVYGVESDWWLPIGYPEDLKSAEEFLKEKP